MCTATNLRHSHCRGASKSYDDQHLAACIRLTDLQQLVRESGSIISDSASSLDLVQPRDLGNERMSLDVGPMVKFSSSMRRR